MARSRGMSAGPTSVVCRRRTGTASTTSAAADSSAATSGKRITGAQHGVPDPRGRARTPDPALVDPVAELAQQRREHGQRSDDRHRHDEHRPQADGVEHLGARQQHSGHRDQDGQARGQDGATRRGRGALQGIGVPRPSLLAFAFQVEERIVHPHGHAHQEHHRARRIRGMEHVTRHRGQPARAQYG